MPTSRWVLRGAADCLLLFIVYCAVIMLLGCAVCCVRFHRVFGMLWFCGIELSCFVFCLW